MLSVECSLFLPINHPKSIIRNPAVCCGLLLLALGATESAAYWWMHPSAAGPGEPVLVYRPKVGLDRRARPPVANGAESQETAGDRGQEAGDRGREDVPAQSPSPNQNPKSNIQHSSSSSSSSNQQSKINNPQSEIPLSSSAIPEISSTTTLLPELYNKAAPMLRCSTGTAARIDRDDGVVIHLAYFEWDHTDTGSVLEAFRHMPEACMGSIGMILVSKEKTIPFRIGSESLVFDYTIFREPGNGPASLIAGQPIHAFRAVWVAGIRDANARQGLNGSEIDRLRTIRLNSAFTRFRPSHARVIQGAVRGAANADAAWQVFQQSMLQDLEFESR